MMNLINQFRGYKTYMIAFSLMVYAVLALYFGKIDANTFADTLYAALGAMAFRSGMKTEGERKVAAILQQIQTIMPIAEKISTPEKTIAEKEIEVRNAAVTYLTGLIEKIKAETKPSEQLG